MNVYAKDRQRGALGDGRAALCHDHDKARLEALLERGGRVVGWRDGFYRVLMPRGTHGR